MANSRVTSMIIAHEPNSMSELVRFRGKKETRQDTDRRWRRSHHDPEVVGEKMRTVMPTAVMLVGFDMAELLSEELGYRIRPGEALVVMLQEQFRDKVVGRMRGVRKISVQNAIE